MRRNPAHRGPVLPVALGAGAAALLATLVTTLAPVASAAVPAGNATGSTAPAPAPGSTAVPSGVIVPGTPCTTSARACADMATRQAWLLSGGRVTRGPVPMMPGAPDEPTPLGTFDVQWKDPDHVSDMPNHAPMPFSVFFAPGGVAFHEGSLTDYSAGCIHLAHDDAVAFYNALQVGDQVQVRPGDPASVKG